MSKRPPNDILKCLSASQPFADLVSGKTAELRGWNTSFCGEFLVHAPLKIGTEDCRRLGIRERPGGGIVGRAEIYDVKYGSASEARADQKLHPASNFQKSTFGFVLA